MTRIPDLIVEKVHLGEATPAERALVDADPDARARLAALPAEDAVFRAAMPVDSEWTKIESRARIANARADTRTNRATIGSIVFAPLLAALLAVLWVAPTTTPDTVDGVDVTGIKGDAKTTPKLRVYRKRSSGAERISSGVVAREGDVIQLGLVAPKPDHGVVVSVDGRGAVTLHWPADPAASTTLEEGETRLPDGYTLDDAPEYERFFLVTTGEAPADPATVIHAAEALAAAGEGRTGDLAVPKGYTQSAFVIRKEVR